jgi:hypothetical protein
MPWPRYGQPQPYFLTWTMTSEILTPNTACRLCFAEFNLAIGCVESDPWLYSNLSGAFEGGRRGPPGVIDCPKC